MKGYYLSLDCLRRSRTRSVRLTTHGAPLEITLHVFGPKRAAADCAMELYEQAYRHLPAIDPNMSFKPQLKQHIASLRVDTARALRCGQM